MATGVDVFDSRELQATLVALKNLPPEISKLTRVHTKKLVDQEWQTGLAKRAVTKLQKRILVSTAVSSVTNSQITLKSATKGRVGRVPAYRLSGGAEFGANHDQYSRYSRRSKNGGTHTLTRRTMRQFGYFRPKGRVVWPTATDLIPRIASMYTQTLIRTTAEVFEN